MGENLIRCFEHRAYKLWIEEYVDPDETFNNCTLWTRVMQRDFPELERIEGYVVHEYATHGAYHEYLKAPDGTIIDPSRAQFDAMFGTNWEYKNEENDHERNHYRPFQYHRGALDHAFKKLDA